MEHLDSLLRERNFADLLTAILPMVRPEADANDLLALTPYLDEIPTEVFREGGFLSKRIAFLSGYTSRYFAQLIRVQLLKSRIHAIIFETDYGLYRQAVLADDSALGAFKPDICFFLVGTDHLSGNGREREKAEWIDLLGLAAQKFNCEVVMSSFAEPAHRVMGNLSFKLEQGFTGYVREMNRSLREARLPSVHFHDHDFLASYYGRGRFRDEGLYALSKVPVAYEFWSLYCGNLAHVFAAVFGRTAKCLVLDLDNTLWGGVVGDDGLQNLQVGEGSAEGESFKAFQAFVKGLRQRGVLLAVCSKNDEKTAKDAFRELDMPLKLEDFSCFVANWEPKHQNLEKIAKQLNIGLDSLVFVDDNPAEREQVRRNLSEINIVDLPADPANFVRALAESGYFEAVSLTSEDLQRGEQYRANAERENLRQGMGSYEDYLSSLEMKAEIRPFDDLNLPRITQLINKTNQFNLTTQRLTEAETRRLSADPKCFTRYAKLKDRFGDNGLISCLVACRSGSDTAEIEHWVMSCRVLKRGMEHSLIFELGQSIRREGIRYLVGKFFPTEKNAVVENLFAELGFSRDGILPGGGGRWRLDLADPAWAEKLQPLAKTIQLD